MVALYRKLRSPRARAQRIDKVFERLFYAILVIFTLWYHAVWISERAVIRIDNIRVEGARVVSETAIVAFAHEAMRQRFLWEISRQNTLLAPHDDIAHDVANLSSWIKDVSVHSENNTLTITVTEHTPELLWCPTLKPYDDTATTTVGAEAVGCYFATRDGLIFASAPDYSGHPFVRYTSAATSTSPHLAGTSTAITIGGSILPADEFAYTLRLRELLAGERVTVRTVTQAGRRDYIVSSNEQWLLHFSSDRDAAESTRNFAVVRKEVESGGGESGSMVTMIDLRFGNKVFYR